jgi:hypothetical protein
VESYSFDFVGVHGVGSLLLTAEETETDEGDYHEQNNDKVQWL